MFMDLRGGKLKPYNPHPTRNGELLFLIFDFTYNFKNIFNNFHSKGKMQIPTCGFRSILGSCCSGLFFNLKEYALEEHKPSRDPFTQKSFLERLQ